MYVCVLHTHTHTHTHFMLVLSADKEISMNMDYLISWKSAILTKVERKIKV